MVSEIVKVGKVGKVDNSQLLNVGNVGKVGKLDQVGKIGMMDMVDQKERVEKVGPVVERHGWPIHFSHSLYSRLSAVRSPDSGHGLSSIQGPFLLFLDAHSGA